MHAQIFELPLHHIVVSLTRYYVKLLAHCQMYLRRQWAFAFKRTQY
nr:MAG TPA: NAPIN BNIB IA AND IB, ALBUMIN [Caudoviricetes sp.]